MKKTLFLFSLLLTAISLMAADVTVTKTIAALATEAGWVNGTSYTEFNLDGVISVKTVSTNGAYNLDASQWRLYQARENGAVTISASEGYMIKAVSFEYATTNTGVLSKVAGTSTTAANQLTSEKTYEVKDKSLTFYVGNTTTTTNGQVRMTKLTVTYCPDNMVVETFSKVSQTKAAPDNTIWNGDYAEWTVTGARRAAGDTLLYYRSQATWTKQGTILKTSSEVEGGIKHLTFNWNRWGAADSNYKLTIAAGSYSNTIEQVNTETNLLLFDEELSCASNVQLSITNSSVKSGSKDCRVAIGNLYITPYLLYTVKTAEAYQADGGYTHTSLINNTSGDPIVYTLEDNDGEATINANTGEVTILTDGEVTVRASWGEVSTTYTLTLHAQLEPELSFEKEKTYAKIGESFFNTLSKATTATPTYVSSNTDVATVDASGNVTPIAEGTTTITATVTADGYYKSGSTSYILEVKPTNWRIETFNSSATTKTYNTTATTKSADIADWTYMLGGVVNSLSAFGGQNAIIIKAPYDESGDEAYIQSSTISGGLSKLRFEWNLNGEETSTIWDIRFIVNGREVKKLTNADIATTGIMSTHQLCTIDNINEPGNFTLRIENHSTFTSAYTSGNKARFAMDNIEIYGYNGPITLDEAQENDTKLTANDGQTTDVTLTRSNLVANVWNTLCLPFDVSVSELGGAEVVTLSNAAMEGDVLNVYFSTVSGTIAAGTPVLVKPTTTLSLTSFSDKTIQATAGTTSTSLISLHGIFSPYEVQANDQTILFVTAPDANGDNLHYASETASIKGFRAYFKLSSASKAPGRARIAIHRETTSTDEVQNTMNANKVIRNGQLLIIKDNQTFNAQGVRIQ